MKSSSTSCAARRPAAPAALIAVALLAAACAGGATGTGRGLEELTNPFLAPEHSQWLIGAVARLAQLFASTDAESMLHGPARPFTVPYRPLLSD